MNYLLIIVTIIYWSLPAKSQYQSQQLVARNPILEKSLLDSIEERYRNDAKSFSGPHKKETIAIYRERADLVKELVLQKEILTDAAATDYLRAVTKNIFDANSNISNKNLRIYFSRSYIPNASSMGEGTILFNIGLLTHLENEAQMAFVLCHELAHYFLNHGNFAIERYVQTINSDEFQKQLKQIQKSEFAKNAQLEKLVQGLSFRHRRHGREFEQAADSMALSLLKNTGYDVNEIISCLSLLSLLDEKTSSATLSIEKEFDFADYPFRKKWINSNSLVFTDSEEETEKKAKLEDSLKTHPDCSKRITQLEANIKADRRPDVKKFLVSEATFKRLQQLFELEALEYCLESGKVSRCLYNTLKKLSADPGNSILLGLAGRSLIKMYVSQKEHSLGKIIDLPNPGFNDDYNTLLKFLQNVRLTELAAIQYYFLQKHQDTGKANEEFLGALIRSKEYFEKPEEKKVWIDYYYSQFPERKYSF